MAYFPHAYQKMLVGTASTAFPAGNGTLASIDLTAGQIGVVNSATNLLVDISTTSGTVYPDVPMVYLAQGSFHSVDKIGPYHGGYKESIKSKGINPKYVSKFWVTEPATAVQNIIKVDSGVNCTSLTCDTTYRLRVDVKGSPALRFLTHNLYRTLDADTGCCDDNNSNVDPNIVYLQWADQINNYPTVKDFIQAKVWNNINNATNITLTASATASPTVTERTGIVAGMRVTFTPTTATSATGSSIAGNVFTVGTATNTIFSVGQTITGTGVAPGTVIVSLLTGGGGTSSTFVVNHIQTVSSTTISSTSPIVAYVKANHTPATGSGTVALVAALNGTSPSTTNIDVVTSSASTPVKVYSSIATATYSPETGVAADTNDSYLELIGTYVNTTFGDCSFNPKDHVEYQPVQIYASIVDTLENVCATTCFDVTETQETFQGRGYGETLVRELILFKRYLQEPFQQDPRMREVLNDTTLTDLSRTAKYYTYNVLHSVPRRSNPSGVMDNDQYLIKIVTSARNSAFEAWMDAYLTSVHNDEAHLEVLS